MQACSPDECGDSCGTIKFLQLKGSFVDTEVARNFLLT